MLLDSKNIPDLQRLINSSDLSAIGKISDKEISLPTCLFLALTFDRLQQEDKKEEADKILQLDLPGVRHAIESLNTRKRRSPLAFKSPPYDVYRIGAKEDLLDEEWTLFYKRFARTASMGRKGEMFKAVGGVLGEMGDNVVCHAFESENKTCSALAAFHVAGNTAAFCVTDFGQGFLKSLCRNPAWAGLKSESEAVDAVVNKQATSRPDETSGGGFRQLFNSLLDFNGLVILRSGGCTYRLENCGSARRRTSRETVRVPGASITVVISPRTEPTELALEKRY